MPHHKSAAKRVITNEKARLRNNAVRSQMRSPIHGSHPAIHSPPTRLPTRVADPSAATARSSTLAHAASSSTADSQASAPAGPIFWSAIWIPGSE